MVCTCMTFLSELGFVGSVHEEQREGEACGGTERANCVIVCSAPPHAHTTHHTTHTEHAQQTFPLTHKHTHTQAHQSDVCNNATASHRTDDKKTKEYTVRVAQLLKELNKHTEVCFSFPWVFIVPLPLHLIRVVGLSLVLLSSSSSLPLSTLFPPTRPSMHGKVCYSKQPAATLKRTQRL